MKRKTYRRTDSPPQQMVHWTFEELDGVGSTQAIAKGLAAMGAPEGTAVVAKSQTSGEGRLGRHWESPPGGLYMSFVLRPSRLPRPEIITLVTALAVAEGVGHTASVAPAIRWPNDVMVGGRKIAGVIAEAQAVNREVTQVVVGVGVNCNAPLRRKLDREATSMFEETGSVVEVSELKHSILDAFSQLYERWQAGENLLPLWKGHVATIGKVVQVKLKTAETPFSFTTRGLDEEGSLVLDAPGETRIVRAEDIEWLREED